MFASSMGYKGIKSHIEEIYDNKISVTEISLTNYYQRVAKSFSASDLSDSIHGWHVFKVKELHL